MIAIQYTRTFENYGQLIDFLGYRPMQVGERVQRTVEIEDKRLIVISGGKELLVPVGHWIIKHRDGVFSVSAPNEVSIIHS